MSTRFALVVGLVVTMVATAGAAFAAPLGPSERPRTLAPSGPEEPATDLPEPIPIPPAVPGAGAGEGFNLVGFTDQTFAANRGILNMTRACQELYAGSRVCMASEILTTVVVPPALLEGLAWVQSGMAPRPGARSDCNGWTSISPTDSAWTIELGDASGCYGGFHAAPCNRRLQVACCAPPVVGIPGG